MHEDDVPGFDRRVDELDLFQDGHCCHLDAVDAAVRGEDAALGVGAGGEEEWPGLGGVVAQRADREQEVQERADGAEGLVIVVGTVARGVFDLLTGIVVAGLSTSKSTSKLSERCSPRKTRATDCAVCLPG